MAEMKATLKPMVARVTDSVDLSEDNGAPFLHRLAQELVAGSDILLNILTTGPRSRPKARKVAGTTSPRRATRAKATPAQVASGLAEMRQAVDPEPES